MAHSTHSESQSINNVKVAVSLAQVMETLENGEEYVGFCIACGESQDGCEPDARRYTCESCGKKAVYGAEELLMMLA